MFSHNLDLHNCGPGRNNMARIINVGHNRHLHNDSSDWQNSDGGKNSEQAVAGHDPNAQTLLHREMIG